MTTVDPSRYSYEAYLKCKQRLLELRAVSDSPSRLHEAKQASSGIEESPDDRTVASEKLEALKAAVLALFQRFGLVVSVDAEINSRIVEIQHLVAVSTRKLQTQLTAATQGQQAAIADLERVNAEHEETIRNFRQTESERLRKAKIAMKKDFDKAMETERAVAKRDLEEKTKELENTRRLSQQQLAEIEAKFKKKYDDMQGATSSELEAKIAALEQQVSADMRQRAEETSDLRQQLSALQEENRYLTDSTRETMAQLKQAQQAVQETRLKLVAAEGSIVKLKDQLASQEQQAAARQQQAKRLADETAKQQASALESLTAQLKHSQRQNEEMAKSHEAATAIQLRALETSLQAAHQRELDGLNDRVRKSIEKRDAAISVLKERLAAAQSNLADRDRELQLVRQEMAAFS